MKHANSSVFYGKSFFYVCFYYDIENICGAESLGAQSFPYLMLFLHFYQSQNQICLVVFIINGKFLLYFYLSLPPCQFEVLFELSTRWLSQSIQKYCGIQIYLQYFVEELDMNIKKKKSFNQENLQDPDKSEDYNRFKSFSAENAILFFEEPKAPDLHFYDIRFSQDPQENEPLFRFTENLSPVTHCETLMEQSQGELAITENTLSNCMKNFITNFVKVFKKDSRPKQMFMQRQDIPPDQKQRKFKKLRERLQKKMKQDGKRYSLDDLKNLLVYKDHKDRCYTRYLLDMCNWFTKIYPEIVRNSRRMGNQNDNLEIIKVVGNLLLRCDIDDIECQGDQSRRIE